MQYAPGRRRRELFNAVGLGDDSEGQPLPVCSAGAFHHLLCLPLGREGGGPQEVSHTQTAVNSPICVLGSW